MVRNMLLKFKFSNYRCFYDETVFDMTATAIKEHRYSLIEKNGVYILPISTIYGANASGKSSFFMAFDRMKAVIVDRFVAKEQSKGVTLPFSQPFIFSDKSQKEPTKYEVTVLINEYEYRYGFSCSNDTIISEYLYKRKISKNYTVEKMIFERNGTNVKIGTINKKLGNEIAYCASMVSDKILILTDIGLRDKEKEIAGLFKWFYFVDVILNMTQKNMSNSGFCERFIGDALSSVRLDDDIKSEFKKLVHEVDPNITDIISKEEIDAEGNTINIARTKHLADGKEKIISLSLESDGTNKWMFLSIVLLFSLHNGLPCFIDELDAQLHPLIIRKIVQMFTDKQLNPNGAQLIFSAHNIINLDSSDLRRDEIWFVEKNNHKSSLYSLADFDDGGIRSDLNYGKHYLSGRFGAVPFQE